MGQPASSAGQRARFWPGRRRLRSGPPRRNLRRAPPTDRATAAPTNNPTAIAQTTEATSTAFAPPELAKRAVAESRPRLPGTSSQNAGRKTTNRGRFGRTASTSDEPRLAATAPRKLPRTAPPTCCPKLWAANARTKTTVIHGNSRAGGHDAKGEQRQLDHTEDQPRRTGHHVASGQFRRRGDDQRPWQQHRQRRQERAQRPL